MVQHAANSTMLRRPTARERGFTIMELLSVVAIIIIILSIVAVAVNAAIRSAQRTNTQALLNSIKQGLTQFREDTGYLPPVLDHARNLEFDLDGHPTTHGPEPTSEHVASGEYAEEIQQWYSITTLADYLLGYDGRVENVGTPNNPDFRSPDGYVGAGIRNPGRDGYWGASINQPCWGAGFNRATFDARWEFLRNQGCDGMNQRYREGAVLGPYIQLRDERLLGAIDPDNPWENEQLGQYQVYLPGEAGFDEELPRVIVDYWGQPIRYYRTPYPPGSPDRAYRRVTGHADFGDPAWAPPSLSHVIVLRPYSIAPNEATDAPRMFDELFKDDSTAGNGDGETTTSRALQSGEYALFSAGPNRSLDPHVRVDEQEYNRDNIVEVGP